MPTQNERLDYEAEKAKMTALVKKLRINEEGMARKYLKEEVFKDDGQTLISERAIHRFGRALLQEKHSDAFKKMQSECTEQAKRVCYAYILKNAGQFAEGEHSEKFWRAFKIQMNANKKALTITANQFFDGADIDTTCKHNLDEISLNMCFSFWPDLCEYDPGLDAYYCRLIDAAYDHCAKVWVVLGEDPGRKTIEAPPPTWKLFREEGWDK